MARDEEREELLKRQAAGIAAQLPAQRDEALRILAYAKEIVMNLGNIPADRQGG